MESDPRRSFERLSDDGIRELIESLSSLHEGELGVSMLVACGERAVPHLRDFLLHGRPSSVFVPPIGANCLFTGTCRGFHIL